MNKEKINQDRVILASLETEYKRVRCKIDSIRALVTDLNFEELIPDSQERCLKVDELQAYDYIRTNLMNRIRFYRARVKREESIKDWSQYKKTDNTYIGVDVSNEGSHSECCQVGGDDIATHHCGQDAVNFEQLSDNLTDTYKDYCRGVLEQFLSREITWAKFVEKVALPFCHENVNEFVNAIKDNPHNCRPGREKCQVDDGSAAVNEAQVPNSIKSLVGMLVVDAFHDTHKCTGCEYQERCNAKKVELVGGYFLCLEELPNSVVTE